MPKPITRRAVMIASAIPPMLGAMPRPGATAEFRLKYTTGQDPSHPISTRGQQAIDRIRAATGGKVDIKLYPANQLGSDTDLLSQVRTGGVAFFNLSTSILATLVPAAAIPNTGFAFKDYPQVWKAADGEVGNYIRAQVARAGLVTFCGMQDNGFRQITTSTHPIENPNDLKGFKIRVPPAPMLTSLFSSLGASPTPINFSELYSALQTKIVEGEENPLAIIATTRLYEVQKYCSLTSHVWDGYWILANPRIWHRLPEDLRNIISREFQQSVLEERKDVEQLNQKLRGELASKGLRFNEVARGPFRMTLQKTSYYKDWRSRFGDKPWKLLEGVAGPLT